MDDDTLYFRHLDGGLCRFVADARHDADASAVVIYEHVWPFEPGIWVRPREEFEAHFSLIPPDEVELARQGNRTTAQAEVKAAQAARRGQRDAASPN